MSELADKITLITGATSGIGRATALHFPAPDATLDAAARTPHKGTKLVAELSGESVATGSFVRLLHKCPTAATFPWTGDN